MKTIYTIIISLSCFALNIKAATPNIESTTLELTYKAGGGFIKSVELGGGSVSYALRIYTTTEVHHFGSETITYLSETRYYTVKFS